MSTFEERSNIEDFIWLLHHVKESLICAECKHTILDDYVNSVSNPSHAPGDETLDAEKLLKARLARAGKVSETHYGIDGDIRPHRCLINREVTNPEAFRFTVKDWQYYLIHPQPYRRSMKGKELAEKLAFACSGTFEIEDVYHMRDIGEFVASHARRLIYSTYPDHAGRCSCPDRDWAEGRDPETIGNDIFAAKVIEIAKQYMSPEVASVVGDIGLPIDRLAVSTTNPGLLDTAPSDAQLSADSQPLGRMSEGTLNPPLGRTSSSRVRTMVHNFNRLTIRPERRGQLKEAGGLALKLETINTIAKTVTDHWERIIERGCLNELVLKGRETVSKVQEDEYRYP